MQIISHSTPFSLHALMFASQLPPILVFLSNYFFTFIYPFKPQYTKCALCMQLCAIYKMRIAHAIILHCLNPYIYMYFFIK